MTNLYNNMSRQDLITLIHNLQSQLEHTDAEMVRAQTYAEVMAVRAENYKAQRDELRKRLADAPTSTP